MKPQERIDFQQLHSERQPCCAHEITFVGGVVNTAQVASWLSGWSLAALPWRLWEEVSALRLEENSALPTDFTLIERGRLFGPAGDLTLRRDGSDFRWWFVGEKGYPLPATHGGQDFWAAPDHQSKVLYRVAQEAIFWGAYQGQDANGIETWYDDRVGYARLHYPPSLAGSHHIYVKYWEYLDHGRVAAVWLYALSGRSE